MSRTPKGYAARRSTPAIKAVLLQTDRLVVRPAPGKGRGVFARRPIARGAIVEQAPVLVVPADQIALLAETVLDTYGYGWGEEGQDLALVLGYGSLYNHSYTPNATYEEKTPKQIMVFRALRAIAPGEEITINYNGQPEDGSPVWFEVYEGSPS